MCGICGVINLSGEPVDASILQSMTATLGHRGPDEMATARPEPWAGLGHTRLKVIDLSPAANQPMMSPDRAAWIVYNGELYNFRALRRELEGHGRIFRSQSDTEVALQAYVQWGEQCVERFDGMFALAVFDARRRRLILARDRTGKKPLFYYVDRERFVFGSEIKALLAHPGVPCEFQAKVLPLYLTYGYVPSPNTFYENIRGLPPATRLVVQWPSGSRRERPYWTRSMIGVPRRRSRAEAIYGLRDRLTEAVRKRLISDVPLGAFLSGGIDSTIVVGLMTRLMRQPVHTFSIGFRGDPAFDETAYARLAAGRIGSRHTEFMVEPKAFELLERLVYHHDQPFGDASAIPTYLLCELAKARVTVALNGDGGDECFAGYRRFQAAVVSHYLPRWVSRGLAAGLRTMPAGVRGQRRVGELMRFCEAASTPWDERLVRWISYFQFPNRLLRQEFTSESEDAWLQPARRHLRRVRGQSALSQALYFNFQEYLPNDLNVKMDRCSMAHGLETRSPFLDTALMEYAAQLPGTMKLQGFRTKVILKEAFKDLLPPAIQRRGKQGFGVPLDRWFRVDLRDAMGDLLLAPDARINAYLRPEVVRAYWNRHQRGERNFGLALWNLLTLEVWLRLMARGGLRTFGTGTNVSNFVPAPISSVVRGAE